MIVSNLLSNAIKFSKENGKIVLGLTVDKGQLLLRVEDDGMGISPDQLPFVFDRFYQIDDAANRSLQGTGIGLTLTRELVELMGGTINVQSPAPGGKGTVFMVSLPIRQQAPKGAPGNVILLKGLSVFSETHKSHKTGKGSLSGNTNLPLLLIIEDNPDMVTYLMACLEKQFAIILAENGAIGIESALEKVPDIIISDVMMPEKDGFEVCRTLKNDERTSHIPIVLLTALSDVSSRLEGLGVGADAYLPKPFLKEELLIRLEKLMELRAKLQKRYTGSRDVVTSDPNPPRTIDDQFLQKIISIVEGNLDDAGFGNVQLAEEMCLSESQLFRKVKALTGQSVAIYIRSIRLQRAKDFIRKSDLPISEIAYQTGFADPAYFSRAFSKEFGISPSKMRKQT